MSTFIIFISIDKSENFLLKFVPTLRVITILMITKILPEIESSRIKGCVWHI